MLNLTLGKDNAFVSNPSKKNPLYPQNKIEWTNWSKSFPYMLKIIRIDKDGNISDRPDQTTGLCGRSFVLPIPPSGLRINTSAATTLIPTLEGIVEQSNGAPFRDISIQGTTGVNLWKGNVSQTPNPAAAAVLAIGSSFFPTVNDAVRNGVRSVENISGSKFSFTPILHSPDETALTEGTGFYQFHALRNFIENYLEAKKTADGKDLRLVFAIFKDQQYYVCSALNFSLDRSANDPLVYNYSIQLKAYRRLSHLNFEGSVETSLQHSIPPAELLGKGNLIVNSVLDILESGDQAILGLVGDTANGIKNTIRSFGLALKRVNNIALTLRDLDLTVQKEIESISSITRDLTKKYSRENTLFNLARKPAAANSPSSKSGNGSALSSPSTRNNKNELNPSFMPTIDTPLKDFALPNGYKTALQTNLNDLTKNVLATLPNTRENLKNAIYEASVNKGGASEVYAEVYKKNFVEKERTITSADVKIINSIVSALQVVDNMIASQMTSNELPNTLQYVAGLANGVGVAFNTPVSKFAVPFPYGYTLERLAQKYLGDANRWYEIAALNGLQSPFVDETGFQYNFVSNGNSTQIYINSKQNLNINQVVYLSSNTQKRETRKILNIRQISSTIYEITVDGKDDLNRFLSSDFAKLESFLPGTVNSKQIIYIPSSDPSPDNGTYVDIPGIDTYDPLIQAAGVDLLLDDTGDFIITPDGDTRLAYGMQNIVQMINIGFSTEKGNVLQHPTYGAGIRAGINTGAVDIQQVSESARNVLSDSDIFSGITSLSVVKEGPVLKLNVVVGIKPLGTNLPLSFTIG